ncbi:MAG: threonine synthase [Bacteroidales bacterium]|nr:threonine synthase [Bacteroidales bacterium]
MKFYSTRDASRKLFTLADASFLGLAPDGGLFVPERIPQVDMERVQRLAAVSYADMAGYLAGVIFDDVPANVIDEVVRSAYDFDIGFHWFGSRKAALELFHGPTFAFKDFGARFMGRMTGRLNTTDNLTILTATSGDTGSAVAGGFYNVPGVDVVILYPDGKVSPLQEAQMTTLGGNIHPRRVRGNFDDCQRLVKAMFNDADLRSRKRITSANSINLLRWIPQSFYYFYAYCLWAREHSGAPEIVVPSGNYGNITAGMLAARMGMPVKRFIAASNANDVVPEFLLTGNYRPRASVRTVANAMDVGAPSNYERMMWLYGDVETLRREVAGFSATDAEILDAIREIEEKYGYVSDPHSAVGYLAAKHYDIDGFWLSTASPAKFGEVIEKAVGHWPEIPAALRDRMEKERVYTMMDASEANLKDYLLSLS